MVDATPGDAADATADATTADAPDVSEELKRTPLEAEHLRLGAKMAPFAGWQMPIEYEGALAEHRAVRTHVGLFDLTHLGKVEVVGAGALGMLQRVVTNDLSRAAVGEALYNLVLNEGGGVIEDLIVYRMGEERYFVVPNASNAPRVLRMLEEEKADGPLHLMYHQDWCFLAVQGPEAKSVMAGIFPAATDLAFMRCVETEYHRRPVIVTRSGYTGEVGFELFTYQDIAEQLWSELLGSVRTFGGAPCGLAARDVLRLEMGYPLYGQDLFEASTAFEAGLAVGRRDGQGRVPRSHGAPPPAGRGVAQPSAGAPDARASPHPPSPLPRVRGRPAGGGGDERDVLARPRHRDRARVRLAGRRRRARPGGRGGHPGEAWSGDGRAAPVRRAEPSVVGRQRRAQAVCAGRATATKSRIPSSPKRVRSISSSRRLLAPRRWFTTATTT